ncbi:hypothetical protein [Neptuniibacter halophilus]|uniref:hypothetical protein n=1 Tax=Neptuniibacter halophilus TaxID=651666 RepID=UPI002573D86C|nr:hypothetical protein [Neptuniibacter halophilus]
MNFPKTFALTNRLVTGGILLMSSNVVLANADKSFGQHLSDHGVKEMGLLFNVLTLGAAFVGFVLGLVCLYGMASIKMFPNSPGAQKFEQAGMGGLAIGLVICMFMIVFGSAVYYFIGTAAGTEADTSAFDKLKGSAIEHRLTPVGQELASLETLTLTAKA